MNQQLAVRPRHFIGALVLLEKTEGTLTAQVVSPLRDGEYIAAKVITLTALALAYNLAVVALVVGRRRGGGRARLATWPLPLGATA